MRSHVLLRNTLTADVFEEGNLAALEGPDEDFGSGREEPSRPPRRPSPSSSQPRTRKRGTCLRGAVVQRRQAAQERHLHRAEGALAGGDRRGTAAAVWFSGLL